MQSFRKCQVGLFSVALTAGGLGVWSELQASPPAEPTRTVGRAVEAWSEDFSDGGYISENGDGTAFAFVGALVSDQVVLQMFDFAATSYSVTGELRPGQSGGGGGSGAGQVTGDGFYFDLIDGTATPAVVSIDIAVADARNAGAYTVQEVAVVRDPLTGEATVSRVHRRGSQAWGLTAGSYSISADGALVSEGTGGYGGVYLFTTNSVERIH